jgi:hypothetical protein
MPTVMTILIIAGVLILIAGTVLLIVSCVKTMNGKMKIGGIIAGSAMCVGALLMSTFGGAYLILSNAKLPESSDMSSREMKEAITNALNSNDIDALAGLFAEESVSGSALTKADAEAVFNLLKSETTVESVKTTRTGRDNTAVTTYTFNIKTDAPIKRVVKVDCVLRSPKPEFKGIQHISISGRDMEKTDFGTRPAFYTQSRKW